MLLEFFRGDPIGIPSFSIVRKSQIIQSIQANYIDYSFRAFYFTMQDIEELELAKGNLVPNGRNSVVASTFWFLALESYINTILKLTSFHINIEFANFRKKTLVDRIISLLKLLNIDDVSIKKTGILSRIHEFSTFRNEIFHDRNVGQSISFQKTKFSDIPVNCNLVDVIQAL